MSCELTLTVLEDLGEGHFEKIIVEQLLFDIPCAKEEVGVAILKVPHHLIFQELQVFLIGGDDGIVRSLEFCQERGILDACQCLRQVVTEIGQRGFELIRRNSSQDARDVVDDVPCGLQRGGDLLLSGDDGPEPSLNRRGSMMEQALDASTDQVVVVSGIPSPVPDLVEVRQLALDVVVQDLVIELVVLAEEPDVDLFESQERILQPFSFRKYLLPVDRPDHIVVLMVAQLCGQHWVGLQVAFNVPVDEFGEPRRLTALEEVIFASTPQQQQGAQDQDRAAESRRDSRKKLSRHDVPPQHMGFERAPVELDQCDSCICGKHYPKKDWGRQRNREVGVAASNHLRRLRSEKQSSTMRLIPPRRGV